MTYGRTYYLGLNKDTREGAGVEAGDLVRVEMELDDAPRVVEIPSELAVALAAVPDARERFDQLSFTHRREYARWITEAKRDETRQRRVSQAVQMLQAGTKTPR